MGEMAGVVHRIHKKGTSLLWMWRTRIQITQNVMTALDTIENIPEVINYPCLRD